MKTIKLPNEFFNTPSIENSLIVFGTQSENRDEDGDELSMSIIPFSEIVSVEKGYPENSGDDNVILLVEVQSTEGTIYHHCCDYTQVGDIRDWAQKMGVSLLIG